MSTLGEFYGIGVGPGEPQLIPVIAWNILHQCDLIYVPRAKTMTHSVARMCVAGHTIPDERWREIEFQMETDRTILSDHYRDLAIQIASEVRQGKKVAYLTIGDPLTYSTYGYTLASLKDQLPNLRYRTIPGVTSFAALAAETDWPLGEGRERILILPCPDTADDLKKEIETHDVVVLMKIADRLPMVLDLLNEMKIAEYCAFGKRVGQTDAIVHRQSTALQPKKESGYLATMLIRKKRIERRHS
ncbi:MAG: precorrin-2 C(20)-methyltransferase [Verrucomicrobiota bacterium]